MLTPEVGSLSLGHLLDLAFGATALEVAGYNLHVDFLRCIGWDQIIVGMRQDTVTTFTIREPPPKLQYSWEH